MLPKVAKETSSVQQIPLRACIVDIVYKLLKTSHLEILSCYLFKVEALQQSQV